MSDVVTALDMLDLAIVRSQPVVAAEAAAAATRRARQIRDRRGFLGDTLVLALAGGTGSGKSSLLNAIAGRRVAETGVLRPTTEQALAWIPSNPEPGVLELLGRLDIDSRLEQDAFARLAIIDLPDHDSIVLQHHQIVERLLPEVDGVVWVFDPQKYRDPLIHDDYIARLADYQDQFVFVLNQIDLLGQQELTELRNDLEAALVQDGIEAPRLFTLAADPPGGAPANIEPFREYLGGQLDAKTIATGKLLADIRSAGRQLGAAAGILGGAGLDYEARWPQVRASVVKAVSEGLGFEDAACRVGDFVTALSVETGGAFGAEFRERFSYPRIEEDLSAAIEKAGAGRSRPADRGAIRRALRRFWFGEHPGETGDLEELRRELDLRFDAGFRTALWDRALLGATLALVEVEARVAAART